jgi:hypothetical protein
MSHFGLLALFALFVSLVFAVIAKDGAEEQARLGLKLFGGFLAAGYILGWVMRALPL